jgi:hypothetical protein
MGGGELNLFDGRKNKCILTIASDGNLLSYALHHHIPLSSHLPHKTN